MPQSKRIRKAKEPDKPDKPYEDFPLFAHATGRWAKKIHGRFHYFGPWDDWQGALQRFQDEKDDLYAGRVPDRNREGLRVRDLCNEFLNDRRHRLEAGEIVQRTLDEYVASCERIVKCFGKMRLVDDLRAEDFLSLRKELAKKRGPVALGNEVGRVRVVFNFAYEAHLIDRPVRFGPSFKRPSNKTLRKSRAEKGPKRFSAKEIRTLLESADAQMKAMILLGINCGLGNGDVARLEKRHVNLKTKWLTYPRPKSGIDRTCPLWPETCEAIRAVLKSSPAPKADEDKHRIFITKYGTSWYKETSDNPIANEFRKLLDACKLHRKGVGFYALRHTFETEAGNTGDQVAVNHIMGHAPAAHDMASVYREGIASERLQRTVEHVHAWLFPKGRSGSKKTQAAG